MQFSTSGAQKRSGWSTFERRRDQWKLDQEACSLVCAIVNLDRSVCACCSGLRSSSTFWFLLSANPSYEEEFMTNHLFAPPQFAILIDDGDGRRITGTASMHDLEQMRVLAQSILRLMPEALSYEGT